MKRILFTGGGGAVYEALYRLWQSRYDMHFVDANPAAFSPAMPRLPSRATIFRVLRPPISYCWASPRIRLIALCVLGHLLAR